MRRIIKKITISVISIFFLFCNFTLAANDTMPTFKMPDIQIDISGLKEFSAPTCTGEGSAKVCEFPWIAEYIGAIYKYAIGIIGILATITLMIGGFLWLSSAGNQTRIGEAKKWIGASITGLVIGLTSYMILYEVNPDLLKLKSIRLGMIPEIKRLIESKTGATADEYKNMPCPTAEELNQEIEIYTTGYYFPEWGNDHESLCMIGMNCSCPGGEPAGRDMTVNCDDIFPKRKNYHPCKPFPKGTPGIDYCNSPKLTAGDVAAPDCIDKGTKLCINGKNYTVQDRGADIKGRRIDIYSGSGKAGLQAALNNTGKATMKNGPCN